MKRQLSAEQIAARDARRLKFRGLVKQAASLTEEQKANWLGKVGCILTADGGMISGLRNTVLLYMQLGTPTIVGGFRQWLKHGRCVRKGEHGAMIWCPTGKRNEETTTSTTPAPANGSEPTGEDSDTHFIIGTVFDVSQTEPINGQTQAVESEAM